MLYVCPYMNMPPLLPHAPLLSPPYAGSYAVSTLSASSGSLEEWDEEGRGSQDQTQVDASPCLDISTLQGCSYVDV